MASSIQLLRSNNPKERPFPGNLLDGQPAINTNEQEPGLFFKASDTSIVKVGPAAITSDGNPPNTNGTGQPGNTIGELWLDKSLPIPVLKIYDGAQWVDAGSGGGGSPGIVTLQRWVKTAVGGETSLSGPDNTTQILSYTPGLEEVFLNGVLLTRDVDYFASSGTSITSLSPLTAGDEVTVLGWTPFNILGAIDGSNLVDGTVTSAKIQDGTISDVDVNSSAGIVASKLSFTQAGSGAAARTIDSRLKDVVSVKDFGAVGDGVADDTAAIQAAISASEGLGNAEVVFPAGRYLITDTISLRPGTKLQGANGDHGGVAGTTSFPNQASDSKGTVIIFNPSTQKSLFVPSLPKGGSFAWSAISIRGLNIWGNTTMDAYHRTVFGQSEDITTSLYAIDCEEVQYSNVENVAIMGFMVGIREGSRCQQNTYTKVFIDRCRVSIEYSATAGVFPTTSVWRDCIMRTCQHVVQCKDNGISGATGETLQIRFHTCCFENVASHGFILTARTSDMSFYDCYGENMAADPSVSDRSCFYAGLGVGNAPALFTLTIIGGQYAGDSATNVGSTSTFLRADKTSGINLIGVTAKRFATGISCTSNTRNKSVFLSNPYFNAVSTLFSNTAGKLVGFYRTVDTGGGSDVVIQRTDYVISEGQLQLDGTSIRLGSGSTTGHIVSGSDNNIDFGQPGTRFRHIFAGQLTTNNDYLLWGKTSYTSLSTDGAWMNRLGFIGASFTSGPAGYFNRNGTDGNIVNYYKDGTSVGSISVTSTATAYNTFSDYRLKENVQPVSDPVLRLNQLKPVNFAWKADGTRVDGFLAHEVQAVIPEAITGTKDEVDENGSPVYQGIDQAKLVPLLTAALQDAIRRIEALEAAF